MAKKMSNILRFQRLKCDFLLLFLCFFTVCTVSSVCVYISVCIHYIPLSLSVRLAACPPPCTSMILATERQLCSVVWDVCRESGVCWALPKKRAEQPPTNPPGLLRAQAGGGGEGGVFPSFHTHTHSFFLFVHFFFLLLLLPHTLFQENI